MPDREFNIALEKYRKRWGKSPDEMAHILQEDWSGEQYKKYIAADRLEAIKTARGCKLIGWPFPDHQILTVRGQIGAKIKADLYDADIKVRQVIRRVLKVKESVEIKYMNRAYKFLDEGFDPFWISVFYMALKRPVVPFWDFLNKQEKAELIADMEKDKIQQLEFL